MIKLSDIAKLANVSKSAVSIALNNKAGVSEETRAHILKVAQENNYQPLRTRHKPSEKKLTIRFVASINGDIIPDDYDSLPFFKELLSCLFSESTKQNFTLFTSTFKKEELVNDLIKVETEETSDGIILLGTNLSISQIDAVNHAFPQVIILDTQCFSVNCNTITMNNRQGGYAAAKYLLDMGHKKIGYIKGRPRINNFEGRRLGFKDAIRSYDLNAEKLPKFYLPAMEIHTIEKNLLQFEQFAKEVTAIFCENDYIAISAIRTLQQLGLRVPEDISVVGFDDIAEASVLTPELTTIHVPIKEIAQEAVSFISMNQKAEQVKKQIFLNADLFIRQSVKNIRNDA